MYVLCVLFYAVLLVDIVLTTPLITHLPIFILFHSKYLSHFCDKNILTGISCQ